MCFKYPSFPSDTRLELGRKLEIGSVRMKSPRDIQGRILRGKWCISCYFSTISEHSEYKLKAIEAILYKRVHLNFFIKINHGWPDLANLESEQSMSDLIHSVRIPYMKLSCQLIRPQPTPFRNAVT
jgi:hypothetical protein